MSRLSKVQVLFLILLLSSGFSVSVAAQETTSTCLPTPQGCVPPL